MLIYRQFGKINRPIHKVNEAVLLISNLGNRVLLGFVAVLQRYGSVEDEVLG